MQLLLADASKAVRAITKSMMASTRFADAPVREAESGEQVVSWVHLRAPGPALIVADWDLPGLDGATLIGSLRELGALDEVAVLFCVNRAQIPLAEAAVKQGARGYVVRPFSDEDLRAKLETMVVGRTTPPSDVLKDIVTSVRARQDLPSLMSLPSAVIAEIFRKADRVHHEAGETLIWPGQGVSSISFITAGQVEVAEKTGAATLRGPGDCYAERAFVCGDPARVTVRALSSLDVVRLSKERMVELARRHPSVKTLLTELLAKPAAAVVVETELSGSLESLSFADLVQFLNASRKTGLLLLEDGAQGVVYFSGGEAHDARVDGLCGDEAFFELSTWKRARFEFRAGGAAGERTLQRSTLRLLMEADARQTPALAS
jgi:two-component system chemotaxis response regulator CheY